MWKWWAAAALVLSIAGCAATDEPYVPPTATADLDATPGPVNAEIFSVIERAESAVGGSAVAVESRLRAYTVSVVADGELTEVTFVGSGIIMNPIGDADKKLESFLESKVVTLADAIDAAANAYPGRVVAAEIDLEGSPSYVVTIESDNETIPVTVDASSAEVSIPSDLP
ncbi:PepSY domain-containing protein [Flaviflexus huanghaiensis]|uniref:PepSY domain-containing protein n=1 Tax=Flaviflexus huanghaiensis TaxID=1111473 RepID=UPI0015F96913|nr:PepSY domain-containing protein [Flaviflexus huanghaiensis]